MPRQSTWVDRQQRRHDSRFFRLLDGSFLFRLPYLVQRPWRCCCW
jgi:hypothetical protein